MLESESCNLLERVNEEGSEEESFVVLGRSLLPDEMASLKPSLSSNKPENNVTASTSTTSTVFPQMPSFAKQGASNGMMTSSFFNSVNPTMSFQSSASDLSPEEIQRKLTDLLQENTHLKETLYQNNLAMKNQFEKLVKWQNEVMKIHDSHKEKFEETKQLIINLRSENSILKKSKSLESKQLEAENLALKSKIQVLESQLENSSEKNSREPSKMEAELDQLVDQLTRQLALVERSRREEIVNHEREMDTVRSEMKITKEQLTAAQMTLTEIEARKESLKLVSSDFGSSSETAQLVGKNAAFYNHHIKSLSTFFDKQKHRHAIIKNTLELAIDMLTNGASQFELRELRDRLSDELSVNQYYDVEKFVTAQNHFQKIFDDYQEIVKKVEQLEKKLVETNEKSNTEIAGLRQQIENFQVFLSSKDQTLEQKMAKIQELEKSVNDFRIENDSIGILKAQVELYQSDFNAERAARQAAVSEKERIAEDLRLLHRRNQQLIEDLAKYQRNGSPSSTAANQQSNANARASSQTQQRYECPKCNFAFSTYEAVEYHVNRCLESEMFP